MHPLDSSLDASLHNQPRVPMRRRTSIDNGCLATNGELMLKLISSNSSADHDDHSNTRRPRRLSLNNVNALPTTFLAGLNTKLASIKTDLDIDCHSSLHENRHNGAGSRLSSQHSSRGGGGGGGGAVTSGHLRRGRPMDESCKSSTSKKVEPMAVSDDNDSFGDHYYGGDTSCDDSDSFCDASYAEPANQEYIQQDLGASCLWDDENFFRQDEQGGSGSCTIKEMDSNNNNNINSEYDFYYGGDEPAANMGSGCVGGGCGGTDHTATSQEPAMGEDDDEHDDQHSIVQSRRQQPNPHHRRPPRRHDDDSLSGGFDDDSSEDSFCDASDFEHANKEYLKTNLGASIFWNSKDMIDMDVDDTSEVGIGTISEAEETAGDH